ncbi:hypothetical protein K8R30_01125 [archaeon]|nr:hypothetical protein [archaeon]
MQNNPRQIRYNKQTDISEQIDLRHQWTFFILNARRESRDITQKIVNYFSSHTDFSACNELEKLESGIIIPKGSLFGKLITLKSNVGKMEAKDYSKIYDTKKWHYDRTLKPMSDIELDIYAMKFRN